MRQIDIRAQRARTVRAGVKPTKKSTIPVLTQLDRQVLSLLRLRHLGYDVNNPTDCVGTVKGATWSSNNLNAACAGDIYLIKCVVVKVSSCTNGNTVF